MQKLIVAFEIVAEEDQPAAEETVAPSNEGAAPMDICGCKGFMFSSLRKTVFLLSETGSTVSSILLSDVVPLRQPCFLHILFPNYGSN